VVLVMIDQDESAESLCDCRAILSHYHMLKLWVKPYKQDFIIPRSL
jgi:hypothetical protein